jgi:GNAT superfamily N-acetyltransferase
MRFMTVRGRNGEAIPPFLLRQELELNKAVETVVTYLEMTKPHHIHIPIPANLKLMLMRLEEPTVHFYRYLYDAVGGAHVWVDRKRLSDAELLHEIRAPGVEIWVLYVGGAPGGYFEVDARQHEVVELKYFGLVPEFQGRGLGKWLMAEAVRACWAGEPKKVTVNTCTLDGPAALPLYQKMGFVPVGREHKMMEVAE